MDPGTELELPIPDYSPLLHDSSPEGVRPPRACSAPQDLVDLELERALLNVSILPDMVSPLEELVEGFPVAPSTYLEPPVPVPSSNDLGVLSINWILTGIIYHRLVRVLL